MRKGKEIRIKRFAAVACSLGLALAVIFSLAAAEEEKIEAVAVIAHSPSTSMKARDVRAQFRWSEVPPKKADYVLVVCRSMLFNPLGERYDCYCQLSEEAKKQPNITGSKYHVYIYRFHDNLSVTRIDHTSFDASR